jgi:hypothetical protein
VLLEACLVLLLLGLAIWMRVVNLRDYGWEQQPGDEGIRGTQLLLMQAGYRPFGEIYASQGPLLLDLLYPPFEAFGGTLLAARLAVAAYSLVGLAGTYWVGRQLAGPVGAASAALLLMLSPIYLQNSRQALAEVVALGPAVLALGAALAYQRGRRLAWLLAAAGLLGLSLLIKPITLAAAPAVGLAILLAGRRPRLRSIVALGAVTVGVIALGVLAVGPDGVREQILDYRLQAREFFVWQPRENWEKLTTYASPERWPLFGLAVLGAALLVWLSPRQGLPVATWGAAAVLLLLIYSPLYPKHAATLLPPTAILAGAAVGRLWQLSREPRRQPGPARLGLLAALALYLWALPAVLAEDLSLLQWGTTPPSGFSSSADAIQSISALTERGDFLLTDYPYFAILTQRLVPPALVDASDTRVRSTGLTAAEVAEQVGRYPTRAVVLRRKRFHTLPGFGAWLDEQYRLVKVYGTRAEADDPRFIYVRRDADLEQARRALTDDFVATPGVEFGGQVRLQGYRLSHPTLAPGGQVGLSMDWEASQQFSRPYRVRTQLIGPDNRVWADDTQGFGDWSNDDPSLPPGRWLVIVWPVAVPDRAPPGAYRLAVGVDDPTRRRAVPFSGQEPSAETLDGQRIVLATVEVK